MNSLTEDTPLCLLLLGLYANKPALQTDIRYVLWAEVSSSENTVMVSTLASKGGRLVLVKIDGVFSVSAEEAKEWSRKLVEATYGTFCSLLRGDVAHGRVRCTPT